MMSKRLSRRNVIRRKERFIMKAGRFIQFVTGLILILILLTGCDGNVENNFSIDNDGFGSQWIKPRLFAGETFTEELQIANHMGIRLEAVNGDIEIEGRDGTDSITVIAQKWAESYNLIDAEVNPNEVEILITDQIDEILIQTLQPGYRQGNKYIVDYHIIIPNHLLIDVSFSNGYVGVTEAQNRLTVDGGNGNVFLSDISADVVVNLSNGSIDGTIALPVEGEIRMSTDNGNIDLSIPTSTSAEIFASVTNGSVKTSNLQIDTAVQNAKSVIGTLSLGDGVINLDTINGNINVIGSN